MHVVRILVLGVDLGRARGDLRFRQLAYGPAEELEFFGETEVLGHEGNRTGRSHRGRIDRRARCPYTAGP